jgi:hypothetical protein
MLHRQITNCTALFKDIWHSLHALLLKIMTDSNLFLPRQTKITPEIYQYRQSSWRCSILQNSPDSFKKYHKHTVQSVAFSKMTNKVSVICFDFSQNLLNVFYLFGANCQNLFLNFRLHSESKIQTKLPKCWILGKNPNNTAHFLHTNMKITMTEK